MKRNVCFFLGRVAAMIVAFHLSLFASQAQTIREAFKAMPDSLTPYLTTNNRLDMMDFMDAKMKAKVTNKLDGETEMLFLSDDSLAVRMSEAMLLEMKATAPAASPADSATVVTIKRTYQTKGGYRQVLVNVYNSKTWEELSAAVTENTLLQLDEKASKIINQ